ncbi:restriction endonuclease subunit S [Aequorivita sp. KMM 9714]|uniref:restriction endonuclease subunit S n=1 Tax=Aequorivita sp. KMM 9714 TaxID=2707173 RepID=UPI0013EDB046|nr:restriction endonuclease subunit S [Aequorivita sp. KMM 9714]NGX84871.1 restriction endonuclease subunit S [Aequorivita sp. KMM 9714]
MKFIDGKIPIGWSEVKMGSLVKVGRGSSPRPIHNYLSENGIPWVKIADATSSMNKYIESTKQFIIEEGRSTSVKPGDLIVSNSATPGIPKIMAINACVHDGWLVFDDYKNIDKLYLYYFFLFFRKTLNHSASGSVFKNLKTDIVRNIDLILPDDLQEQKAIAQVLTAFDDKIENLQAQNQTLETLAQTIFKEWFGKYQVDDELPEGWRVGEIGDLTVIKRGGSPRPIKDYISDSGYRWLKISDATATDSPYIFEIKEHIKVEGLSKTTLKKAGDLVLSNSATPGMPKFLAVDTCVHDGWMHFPSSIVSNEYLYLLFLHIRPKLVQQGSGSVFVNLKTDILRYYETIIPSNQALKDFDKLIKPVFDKILNNSKQIQSLTKTRDTLLPKLMSGQLRVEGFKSNL